MAPKGRTLWDIITGRNKSDLTPLELQYHNPLRAKVGCVITFENEANLSGINFVIEKISIYETKIKESKFYHTDYHLKGIALEMDQPLRIRLRLVPDNDETNDLQCKLHVLSHSDEFGWNEEFYNNVLLNEDKEFLINVDAEGNPLQERICYWRIDDVADAYQARVTLLSDKDGDGTIDQEELERSNISYWDYHRDTVDVDGIEFCECLWVEMDKASKYFTIFTSHEVLASQVTLF